MPPPPRLVAQVFPVFSWAVPPLVVVPVLVFGAAAGYPLVAGGAALRACRERLALR